MVCERIANRHQPWHDNDGAQPTRAVQEGLARHLLSSSVTYVTGSHTFKSGVQSGLPGI